MSEQNAQDRDLPATERKLRQAREDGQVARSRDFGHFAIFVPALNITLQPRPFMEFSMEDTTVAALLTAQGPFVHAAEAQVQVGAGAAEKAAMLFDVLCA